MCLEAGGWVKDGVNGCVGQPWQAGKRAVSVQLMACACILVVVVVAEGAAELAGCVEGARRFWWNSRGWVGGVRW